jgi:hypothetical protein
MEEISFVTSFSIRHHPFPFKVPGCLGDSILQASEKKIKEARIWISENRSI